MLDHSHHRRRRASAVHRRVARDLELLEILEPRFSPTAIFPDETLPTLPLPVAVNPPPIIGPPRDDPPPVSPPSPLPSPNRPPLINLPSPTPSRLPPASLPNNHPGPDITLPDIILSDDPPSASTPLTPSLPSTTPPAVAPGPTSSAKANQNTTSFITVSRTVPTTSSSTSSSAAPSNSSTSTGVSTGAVVGGIGAGLVGIAAVIFAIFFFVRRWRRQSVNDINFNAHDFRRSAVLVDDPSPGGDSYSHGHNPRPPTMIERKLAAPPPAHGIHYNHGNYSGYEANDYSNFASVNPGEIMVPNGSDPFSSQSLPQNPQRSITPPHVAPYATAYHNQGHHPGGAAAVARQASIKASTPPPSGRLSPGAVAQYPIPVNDYVDLDRSSVSPFQAAQYAEISQRLYADIPTPVSAYHNASSFGHRGAADDAPPPLPAHPAVSPFADPEMPRFDDLSPARSLARVDSMPPRLPEIHVRPHVSGYDDFPTSPFSEVFPIPPNTTHNGFPSTPSPLASRVALPQSSVNPTPAPAPRTTQAHLAEHGGAAPAGQGSAVGGNRPPTVYDAGDAYGGF